MCEPEPMEWIAEIDTLIFSGGGVRGIVFVGALEELQQQYPGVLSQLKHVAGTVRQMAKWFSSSPTYPDGKTTPRDQSLDTDHSINWNKISS